MTITRPATELERLEVLNDRFAQHNLGRWKLSDAALQRFTEERKLLLRQIDNCFAPRRQPIKIKGPTARRALLMLAVVAALTFGAIALGIILRSVVASLAAASAMHPGP